MKLYFTNETKYKIPPEEVFVNIAGLVLKSAGQPVKGIVAGLSLVAEDKIKKLNKEHRNNNKPTDVLAFRSIGAWKGKKINKANYYLDYDPAAKLIEIGQVFICVEIAKAQASEYKHSLNQELAELFVHGLLHLLGYDHETGAEADEMRELEQKICKGLAL
ncbi:MAG: rRNA maturation RNase YbeY [Firmicutes bacterium]|nr:rRNA maturation RNase YbeY [Bacillota bacterium]